MSITKQLIELMGSSLDVKSVYGEGSDFSFAVEQPVIKWDPVGPFEAHMPDVHRSAYRELFHAPDACILVIDDTPMNLSVIRGLLKKTQIVIDTAESGAQALDMVAKQSYDVIFIDHMMPEMDGIETLHALKKLPQLQDTVFIALTANAVTGAREMYMEAGFTDYISKPVDGTRLESMLVNYLPLEKVSVPAGAFVESTRPIVLIADDDEEVCRTATKVLADEYRTCICKTAAEVAAQVGRSKPDLILLSVRLGETSGFEVLQSLKRGVETCGIPVLLLLDEENPDVELLGLRNGATDFIRKAYLQEVLARRVRNVIEMCRTQSDLQNEIKQQSMRTERLSKEMMLTLSKAVDAKDKFTNGHSLRVAAYSAEIARRMGQSVQAQERIYEAALLHDVGKIGVSENLLNKVGKLTEEEFASIKRHTVIGSEILDTISEMPDLAIAARAHHEWYDGSGYPDGLSGSDIPELARIICVADSYDAMTSTRTYSAAKTQEEVRVEIQDASGTQFDPRIARIMLDMIDEDTDFRMNEQFGDVDIWKNHAQLWNFAQEEPETTEEDAADALPTWLYRVEELDVFVGMRCCGSAESYLEVLKAYAESVATNADEIEAYWSAGDIENTTIKVHALKSTSKTIGETALGELAERLEAAGKAGDTAMLEAEMGTLLAQYRQLGEHLAPLLAAENDADLPLIDVGELHEAYDAIREFSEALDFESVVFTIDSLRAYRIPETEQQRFGNLVHAVENYDWDKISNILSRD